MEVMILVRKWRRHIGFVWKANEGSIPSSRTICLVISNLWCKNFEKIPFYNTFLQQTWPKIIEPKVRFPRPY